MIAKRLAISLLLLLAAGLLSAGPLPAAVSAQGAPPPPARLPYDGLHDIPRLPLAEGAAAPNAPLAAQAPDFADWTRLVFQSARNEQDWEIYNASGYGGEQWNVSNHPSMDIHPRLNPGATRIVFASNRDGNYEIYVMNGDGSGQTRLTFDGANDVYPAWSPDGAQIVFQSYRDGNQAEIYAMNADGSNLRRLTYHGEYDGEPAWSPDGSQIAFTRRSADQYRIWVMNADGGAPRQISNQSASENPIWSPDGRQIAYDSDGDGDGWQELWLMDADGGNQRQLYDPGSQTDAWARSWAPGGQYIAFTRISFTQYQGEWYWTTAYLNACDVAAPWNIMGLNSSGADWYPDWQKTDIWPPTSSVLPLPAQSPAPFVLAWAFEETQSLIADLVIQMRDGPTGEWINLKTNAWQGELRDYFTGLGGHTYYFRSQATDNAGNVEPWPADYDAVTTIEALPPQTMVEALPAFSRSGVEVRWGGYDLGGSEMRGYDVQVRQGNGAWTDWQTGIAETAAYFEGTAGERYSFRVRGRDAAQNLEAWPTTADAATTLYAWAISGNATDNRGAPVAELTTTTTPAAFQSTPSDTTGAYVAYGADPAPNYTVTWHKAGYGALAATAFPADADATVDIVLPPADNVVQNWGFEDGAAAWQFGGNLNGEVTPSDKHTGGAAALLGAEARALGSVTQLDWSLRSPDPKVDAVMDAAGGIHCAWIEPTGRIMYSKKLLAGPWSTPSPLPGPPAHWGGHVKLAVDSAGVIHAVWVAEDTHYYSRKQTGAAWSTPESIPGTGASWQAPMLTIGASGTVKLIYVGPGASGVGYVDAYFTVRTGNGAWSAPRNITDTYGIDQEFKTIIDPTGLIHLLWDGTDTNGYFDIYYAAENSDGSWLPAVNLSENVSHALGGDMAIDSSGTIHVTWVADGHVYWRSRAAVGTWSPTAWVVASGSGETSLAADALGRIHLVWLSDAPSRIRHAVRSNGAWAMSPDFALPALYVPWPPTLMVDRNNRVHLAWFQQDQFGVGHIYYAAQGASGAWSPTVAVYQNIGDTRRPTPFLDPYGRPHLLWQSDASGPYTAFYTGPKPADANGEATLAQTLLIPAADRAPTLSYLYRFGMEFPSSSRLEAVIDDGASSTTVFSTNTGADTWQHAWADLTPWAGRSVTLRIRLSEAAGSARAWAYIDEVTVGSAHPDTWVSLISQGAAAPGAQAKHTIIYGNRGAAASSGQVTLQLPPNLTFVSANPPPSATTPELRWDVGDLAGGAAPAAIQVVLRVAAGAVRGTTLTATAAITSDTPELEQANNTAQAEIYVGHRVRLPVLRR